ncbi:MAG: OmpA family protein [Myxococcota bacterium]
MFLLAAHALAQDVVSLEYVKAGQVGLANPALRVIVNQELRGLTVSMRCGGTSVEHAGQHPAGDRVELPIKVPVGSHTCRGTLSVLAADGSEGAMPLSFGVAMHPALGITLKPGSLDLAARRLTVTLDRPSSKVEVDALGLGGAALGGGLLPVSVPAGTPIEVEWKSSGEVLKLKIRGYDADGFFSEIELVPWSYTIPHEDVVFATDSAVIEPAEEPKLRTALADARKVVEKYGKDVIIKLYVGGHTDTVGDAAHNRELSMKRARAIAGWFEANGFPGDIFFQGYGEGDLAVPTGDGVDEPRNRRVAYLLAARPPEAGGGGGDHGWEKLK